MNKYIFERLEVEFKEWDKKVRLIERDEDSRRFNEMLDLFQEAFEIIVSDLKEEVRDITTEGNPAPSLKTTTEQELVKEPDIPLEKVRMVLAEKIQLGFAAEVRGLIQKYGVDKLSAVDKVYYADILKDAEGLEKLEEKPFPQEGDKYWLIESDGDVWLNNWWDATYEQKYLEQGNVVKTEQQAKNLARARALIQAIKVRRRELNGDCKLNFEKDNFKYAIHYCAGLGTDTYVNLNIASPFGYYETKKSAQKIIDEFHDDLIWYFTEYVPEVN